MRIEEYEDEDVIMIQNLKGMGKVFSLMILEYLFVARSLVLMNPFFYADSILGIMVT